MPGKLWATLRVLVATDGELAAMLTGKRDPMQVVGKENEVQARTTIRQALDGVLAALEGALERCRRRTNQSDGFVPTANVCQVYLEGQARIVADAINHL